jgi:serine protease Do
MLLSCVLSSVPCSAGTLTELAAVQSQVQAALPHVRPALLALRTATGSASGVIVTPEGLVLTATHVTVDGDEDPKPGKRLKAWLTSGRLVMTTVLGVDTATDAALLKLDGERTDWPFVSMQRAEKPLAGDWCFALGHPGGYDPSRGDVLRVGRILKVMPNGLQTDCVLMGGDSGGPLFSLDGTLIGIHSQIWEGRDQNVHVSMTPFLRSWNAMKDGAIVREWGRGAGGWLGVITRVGAAGELEVAEVAAESPAARAGLRAGDHLFSLDGQRTSTAMDFSNRLAARAAGDAIVLSVRNRSGERLLTIRLGQRPKD